MKVFLGGTCNESKWRDELIPLLKCDYFNPVVDDWTEDCIEEEERQKEICDFSLFVITPKMKGVYSIAEAVDFSNKFPRKTIFCVLQEDDGLRFDRGEMMSLNAVCRLINANGAIHIEHGLDELSKTLDFMYGFLKGTSIVD